jgi:hypothetical protein
MAIETPQELTFNDQSMDYLVQLLVEGSNSGLKPTKVLFGDPIKLMDVVNNTPINTCEGVVYLGERVKELISEAGLPTGRFSSELSDGIEPHKSQSHYLVYYPRSRFTQFFVDLYLKILNVGNK